MPKETSIYKGFSKSSKQSSYNFPPLEQEALRNRFLLIILNMFLLARVSEYHTRLPDVLSLAIFSQINCMCIALAPESRKVVSAFSDHDGCQSLWMILSGKTFRAEWKIRLDSWLTIATLMLTIHFIISCHFHNP